MPPIRKLLYALGLCLLSHSAMARTGARADGGKAIFVLADELLPTVSGRFDR